MPNQTYAKEWLDRSKRNLETAVLLFNHNHYTDVIAIDKHQTLEKVLTWNLKPGNSNFELFACAFSLDAELVEALHCQPKLFSKGWSK